ncbi:MAG TPA: hypothetical protein VNN72_02450, partial [Polyangiaceae bacterium]|nr:hypothetical protein [Polyangiaceae bacterium]
LSDLPPQPTTKLKSPTAATTLRGTSRESSPAPNACPATDGSACVTPQAERGVTLVVRPAEAA